MLVVVGAVRRRGAGDGGGGVLLWVCWCAKGVLVAGCCAGREGVSGRAGRGDAAHLGQEGGDGGRRMVQRRQRNKSGRAAMIYVSILFFCFRFFELNVCWPSLFFEKTEVRTVISGDVLFHITILKNIGTAQHLQGFLPTQNLNFGGTSGLVIIVLMSRV